VLNDRLANDVRRNGTHISDNVQQLQFVQCSAVDEVQIVNARVSGLKNRKRHNFVSKCKFVYSKEDENKHRLQFTSL